MKGLFYMFPKKINIFETQKFPWLITHHKNLVQFSHSGYEILTFQAAFYELGSKGGTDTTVRLPW